MELIQHNDNLPSRPVPSNIVKVPDVVYQIMYDLAQRVPEAQRKEKILKVLVDWVSEAYPSKVIMNFSDYSESEAQDMRIKTGYDLHWGMYVLIGDGTYGEATIEQALLEEPPNEQITNT